MSKTARILKSVSGGLVILIASAGYCLQDIPYVKQKPMMCGAACLSMVYKSFGDDYTQDEIYERSSVPCIINDKKTATFPVSKVAKDALGRGYHAVAMQAKDPAEFFKLFSEIKDRVRVIVSTIPGRSSHLILLIDVTRKDLVFHDPAGRPSYHMTRKKFIKQWVPPYYSLIAISKDALKTYDCPVCGRAVPDSIKCLQCGKDISLEPKEVLGCVHDECSGKMWTLLFCPYCSMNIDGIQNGAAKGLLRKKISKR